VFGFGCRVKLTLTKNEDIDYPILNHFNSLKAAGFLTTTGGAYQQGDRNGTRRGI
jgi:hypothetical protein